MDHTPDIPTLPDAVAPSVPRSFRDSSPAVETAQVLLLHDGGGPLTGLGRSLRQEGYEVAEVGWVAELFDYFREPLCSCSPADIPDLVIADLDGFGGPDTLGVLADVCDSGPMTQLIVLASRPKPELRRQVGEITSAFLLEKPCTTDEVRYLALTLVRPS